MIDLERFRDLMAAWSSGVAVVACRTDERVVATTVAAFLSLSLDPPLVLVALGANATVRPFLEPGQRFGVSILGAHQRRLATDFADPMPVGPDPFPPTGDAIIADALVSLICTVDRVQDGGDHALVIAAVLEGNGGGGSPLVRFDRKYRMPDW